MTQASSSRPPRAAVSVSRVGTRKPCDYCPEGTSPHLADYELRWRDGAVVEVRGACGRALAGAVAGVLAGDDAMEPAVCGGPVEGDIPQNQKAVI